MSIMSHVVINFLYKNGKIFGVALFALVMAALAPLTISIFFGHAYSPSAAAVWLLLPGIVTFSAWIFALNDFRATPRDVINAVRLLLRGYDAPAPSPTIDTARGQSVVATNDGPPE